MNYIPVDASCVEELFNQGRTLYDRIHPVTDFQTALECANKGRLFMKCSVSDEELSECLRLQHEIKELQQRVDEVHQKIVEDSQLALADSAFRSFSLEAPNGESITVSQTTKLVIEDKYLKSLYEHLGKDDGPIERQVVYKPTQDFKNAVTPFVDGVFVLQSVDSLVQDIITRHKIDETPATFLKHIGKSNANRITKMQKLYGFNRADAKDYAYLIKMAENWEVFSEFYVKSGNGIAFDDFKAMISQWCKPAHNIQIRAVLDD